jgi:glycosyltransferase involved in cell wall biosynthesis
MLRTALQAVWTARKRRARLLLITDGGAAVWCSLASLIMRSNIPSCAFTFNYPIPPTGIKRWLMSLVLRRIDEFFVHSSLESALYSKHFKIPIGRFKVRLWGIGKPNGLPEHPLHPQPYVCAIGSNGRDYTTLMDASRLIPHIPVIAVVLPSNLEGMVVPGNVRVLLDTPFEVAMNTLRFSEFMVLPLVSSTTPCGHVTLVCAMHLRKAVIATDSGAICDYVINGHNGILCPASSPTELAAAISKLWDDPELTGRLAAANEEFGAMRCTEDVARRDFAELMIRHELLTHTSRER